MCIRDRCNQTVKFSDLLNESKKMGADALATGHYAIRKGSLNNASLHKAKDFSKDQSFFLFATQQEQLNYVRFPLGYFKKSEIRQLAKKYNLSVSEKPDSQDICFVTSDSKSISLNVAFLLTTLSSILHIQPAPSLQGVHWPQLSCL